MPDLVMFRRLLLATSVLSGCSAIHLAVYPADWPQEKAVASAACPEIAGRYLNAGTQSPDWYANMDYFCVKSSFRRTNWICNTGLATDLVDDPAFLSARVIEIKQPDSNTLSISVPDNPSIQPRILTRGHGDFECGSLGITMSLIGSDMSAGGAVLSLLVLHVGVASSSRSFRPLSDESLLMEVTNKHFITQEILGTGTIQGQGFVRWDREAMPAPTRDLAAASADTSSRAVSDAAPAGVLVLAVMNSAQGRTVIVPNLMASDDASAVVSAIRSHTPGEFTASLAPTSPAGSAPFLYQTLDYVCVIGSDGQAISFGSTGIEDSWGGSHGFLFSDQSIRDAISIIDSTGTYSGSFVCSLERSVRWPEGVRTQVIGFLKRIPIGK